jgi:hypothetical protein
MQVKLHKEGEPVPTNKQILESLKMFIDTMKITDIALRHEGNITLIEFLKMMALRVSVHRTYLETKDGTLTFEYMETLSKIDEMLVEIPADEFAKALSEIELPEVEEKL